MKYAQKLVLLSFFFITLSSLSVSPAGAMGGVPSLGKNALL